VAARSPWGNKSMSSYRTASLILLAVVSLPLLVIAYFYIMINGGIANAIRNLKPTPDLASAALKSDRTRLAAEIDAAFQGVAANTGFVYYATSTHDRCYPGQNNFHMTEGFAHRCTLRLTRFYGFDGDFRQAMIDLEKRFLAAGWKLGRNYSTIPSEQNMAYMMTHYYDVRPNVTVDQIARPLGYNRANLILVVDWAERTTKYFDSLAAIQRMDFGSLPSYDQTSFQNGNEFFKSVTRDHRYILGAAIYGHYFEN
jgi:hypothetical protein